MEKYVTQPNICAVAGPNQAVLAILRDQAEYIRDYAEIGIYEGATAVEAAKILNNKATIHLFDYQDRCRLVADKLKDCGKTVYTYSSNPEKLFDSYNWGLAQALKIKQGFDVVFIDGAHTWHHDALAFLLVDRMLRYGGFVIFDDLGWTYGTSPTLNPKVYPKTKEFYTDAQIKTPQVDMIIDLLVKPDSGYSAIAPNIYRKV